MKVSDMYNEDKEVTIRDSHVSAACQVRGILNSDDKDSVKIMRVAAYIAGFADGQSENELRKAQIEGAKKMQDEVLYCFQEYIKNTSPKSAKNIAYVQAVKRINTLNPEKVVEGEYL